METATRSFAKKINRDSQPRVLILSEPDNPKLENVAHQVLAQEGNSLPLNRRALVKAIGPDDLRALDNNQIDPNLIGRLMATFDTENLVLVNLKRASTDNDDLVKSTIFGDLYQRGEAIQGSPVNASSAIRVDSSFAARLNSRPSRHVLANQPNPASVTGNRAGLVHPPGLECRKSAAMV